jgi:hypothetical protein
MTNLESISIGDILLLHLDSSQLPVQQVIGGLESVDENGFTLSKPVEFAGGKRPDQSLGFGFQPYLSMGGILPPISLFTFPTDIVIFFRGTPPNIRDSYLEFTSGIVLAKAMPPSRGPLIKP